MAETLLKVEGLQAWYGESHILHGVGFEIGRGELVTLLGRNGAGKTTTLKSVMGIVEKRTGSVSFEGKETVGQPSDGSEFANLDALNILVRTDPQLRPGDQVFILLDGAPVNNGAPTGPLFTLTPVERGSHTLQAVVRDAGGELLCQTPGVRFEVHQASIKNPANPVRPH